MTNVDMTNVIAFNNEDRALKKFVSLTRRHRDREFRLIDCRDKAIWQRSDSFHTRPLTTNNVRDIISVQLGLFKYAFLIEDYKAASQALTLLIFATEEISDIQLNIQLCNLKDLLNNNDSPSSEVVKLFLTVIRSCEAYASAQSIKF